MNHQTPFKADHARAFSIASCLPEEQALQMQAAVSAALNAGEAVAQFRARLDAGESKV